MEGSSSSRNASISLRIVEELLAQLGGVARVEVARAARLDARALQLLLRARDRESLAIEELANAHQVLDVAPGVNPLALRALGGPDRAKLALPVAKHVRLDPDELGDLADAEVQLRRQAFATRLSHVRRSVLRGSGHVADDALAAGHRSDAVAAAAAGLAG